jgi:hypothetical protein
MTVRRPTAEQIAELADRLGLSLEADELVSYRNLLGGLMQAAAARDARTSSRRASSTSTAAGAHAATSSR